MADIPVNLDIRADMKQARRNMSAIQKSVSKKVLPRALNETATAHRTSGAKRVARKLRIQQKFLLNRYDKNGIAKAKRTRVIRAHRNKLWADIAVYVRGIPIIQLVTRAQRRRSVIQNRGGVKRAGGKTYKRAFIAEGPAGSGNVQVFVRKGTKRYPLGVPRVGVRKRLVETYRRIVQSSGRRVFKKRFRRLVNHEISRQGRKA